MSTMTVEQRTKAKADSAERVRLLKRRITEAAQGSGLAIPRMKELRRDLAAASVTMGPIEARYLVDYYYLQQDDRRRTHSQVRELLAGQEPFGVVAWLAVNAAHLEDTIRERLGQYADSTPLGQWLQSITGIGPVLSAGFMAHIDITQSQSVSQLWRFAGQDPTQEWLGKAGATALVASIWPPRTPFTEGILAQAVAVSKRHPANLRRQAADKETGEISRASLTAALARRPWNNGLKVLCWKAGESFVKQSSNPDDDYGRFYKQRKDIETRLNEQGGFAAQAAQALEKRRYGADTVARKYYEAGQLPPAHIHARAKRWAVKLFLSHYFEVAWTLQYGEPPAKRPYVMDHLGHQHNIPIPHWPSVVDLNRD